MGRNFAVLEGTRLYPICGTLRLSTGPRSNDPLTEMLRANILNYCVPISSTSDTTPSPHFLFAPGITFPFMAPKFSMI